MGPLEFCFFVEGGLNNLDLRLRSFLVNGLGYDTFSLLKGSNFWVVISEIPLGSIKLFLELVRLVEALNHEGIISMSCFVIVTEMLVGAPVSLGVAPQPGVTQRRISGKISVPRLQRMLPCLSSCRLWLLGCFGELRRYLPPRIAADARR